MKTILPLALALAASVTFVSCDSKEEKARANALEKKADALEAQADATRKVGEARAEAVEAQKPVVENNIDQAAENERKAAEAAAAELKRQADAARNAK